MKEHPILMSTEIVKAIREGRKTQTRRVIKPQYTDRQGHQWYGKPSAFHLQFNDFTLEEIKTHCPYIDHSVNIQPIPQIDKYGAGDDGHIYRIDKPKPSVLKPWAGGYKNGYQMIRINSHNEYVHQLVCQAFYGVAPTKLPEVRHLDGNSLNNKPPNLDWGTSKQNALDRYAHGKLSGENHPLAKLSWDIVEEIKLTRKDFTIPELAQKYDVSHGTIEKIIYGQNWRTDIKPEPPNMERYIKPLGRLWVRETFTWVTLGEKDPWKDKAMADGTFRRMPNGEPVKVCYKADGYEIGAPWRPSIFMPRWASRIDLEITEVRAQKVREITEADVKAEGLIYHDGFSQWYTSPDTLVFGHKTAFKSLWDSLNAKRGYSWDVNPWVWVVSFRKEGD